MNSINFNSFRSQHLRIREPRIPRMMVGGNNYTESTTVTIKNGSRVGDFFMALLGGLTGGEYFNGGYYGGGYG